MAYRNRHCRLDVLIFYANSRSPVNKTAQLDLEMIVGTKSWVVGRGSWAQSRSSWVPSRRSSVPSRGSWFITDY